MTSVRRRCAGAALGIALALALGGDAWAAQGGARGPFEAARLSDEPLTDDPGGAFEVLLLSAGVALLAASATCAFLALAKLGALERALQREGARRREEAEGLRADVAALTEATRAASEGGGGEAAVDAVARLSGEIGGLEAAIDRVRVAVERSAAEAARAPTQADPGPDLARLGDDLRGFAEAARESSETASRRAAEALRAGLAEVRDALGGGAGGAAPAAPSGAAGVVERIQTRLLAMGYTEPVVVSAADDIASAVESGGAVVVEARRAGSVHKGRVTLDGGAIAGVELRPSHDIFP